MSVRGVFVLVYACGGGSAQFLSATTHTHRAREVGGQQQLAQGPDERHTETHHKLEIEHLSVRMRMKASVCVHCHD